MSGFAVLVGLLVGWQQLGNTSETLRVSQEGQITDRFTRAVEQLASDELTVRLGGFTPWSGSPPTRRGTRDPSWRC